MHRAVLFFAHRFVDLIERSLNVVHYASKVGIFYIQSSILNEQKYSMPVRDGTFGCPKVINLNDRCIASVYQTMKARDCLFHALFAILKVSWPGYEILFHFFFSIDKSNKC
jgi:hypothetical protein